MKVEKRDGSQERRILTGMIVDNMVLARIASKWEEDCFKSTWANTVGQWCVDYHNRYGIAPRKAIVGLFEAWADGKDKETVQIVDRFLSGLSGEYESLAQESNSEHTIDMAAEHFNRVKVSRLAEALQGDVDSGNLDKALKRITGYNRIEMGAGGGVNVMADVDAMREAFESKSEPLIHYPGDLGKFFGDALERDGLIVFQGPEKRGKTWWLIDMAWRGMLQQRRVAFFEVGDMSQNQIMRRFMQRAAKRPWKPKTYHVPTSIDRQGDNFAEVELEERTSEEYLDWRTAHAAMQEVLERRDLDKTLLRLACYPNSTLSVHGLASQLQSWDRQGWAPDVVVVDYADILAPVAGVADTRDQINATWKGLRALSQSLHCLVVTATQANAESYRVETLTRNNFSEDKRKMAHVTGMVGLNQTAEEKEKGIMRLNWIVLREAEYSENKCVHVAGCMAIGNPAMKSVF